MADPASDPTGNLYKVEGNNFLEKGKTREAIESYTKAIACDANNHFFHSNRSAAYLKMFMFQEALVDATECLRIEPGFIKAYTRKAASLLSLQRYVECMATCIQGLAIDKSNKVLLDTQKACKRCVVTSALSGCWSGSVGMEMGGYPQMFEFVSDSAVFISALSNRVSATYTLNVDKDPLWLNISLSGIPPGAPVPPEVGYIFKFETDILADFNAAVASQLSSSGKSKSLETTTATTTSLDVSEVATVATNEIDIPLPKELTICCPFMSNERPRSFGGAGMCVLNRVDKESKEYKIMNGERFVSPEILALDRTTQLQKFCEAMLEVMPESAPAEFSPNDSREAYAAKMAAMYKVQNDLLTLDCSFPMEISVSVQNMCEGTEEPPAEIKHLVNRLKARVSSHQQPGAQMNEEAMRAQLEEVIKEQAKKKAAGDASKLIAEAKANGVTHATAPASATSSSSKNKKKKNKNKTGTNTEVSTETTVDTSSNSGFKINTTTIAVAAAALTVVVGAATFLLKRRKD